MEQTHGPGRQYDAFIDDLRGVIDEVGTIEIGKLADVVVRTEDPLQNISATRKMSLALKEGKLLDLSSKKATADYMELYC